MFNTNELRSLASVHVYQERTAKALNQAADEIETLQHLLSIKDGAYDNLESTFRQRNDELELLRWRIETALKASCLQHIDSPQEKMEMILRGDYDNNREEALRDDQYAD